MKNHHCLNQNLPVAINLDHPPRLKAVVEAPPAVTINPPLTNEESLVLIPPLKISLTLETLLTAHLLRLSARSQTVAVLNERNAGDVIRSLNVAEVLHDIDVTLGRPIGEDIEVATIDRESVTDHLTGIGGAAPEEETTAIDVNSKK